VYFHAAEVEQEAKAHGRCDNQAERVMEQYGEGFAGPGAGADPTNLSMAHRDQISDFVRAVEDDREPSITVEEGRKPLAIIAGIYESARTGEPVRIGERKSSGEIR
jgi:UDP-N-acetyl-2-amino-2-deoxyglucuronate dehydrogenase